MSGARFGRATPAAALGWIGVRKARRSTGNGVCEERGSELRGRSGDGGGIHAERRVCWEERPTGLGSWLGEAGGGGERNPGDTWAITWVAGWMVGPLDGKRRNRAFGDTARSSSLDKLASSSPQELRMEALAGSRDWG